MTANIKALNLFTKVSDMYFVKCLVWFCLVRNITFFMFNLVGGIFGYCDFLLERYRSFDAVATSSSGAMVAVFTRVNLNKMKRENAPLYVIVQQLLLRASLSDLANCTCHN